MVLRTGTPELGRNKGHESRRSAAHWSWPQAVNCSAEQHFSRFIPTCPKILRILYHHYEQRHCHYIFGQNGVSHIQFFVKSIFFSQQDPYSPHGFSQIWWCFLPYFIFYACGVMAKFIVVVPMIEPRDPVSAQIKMRASEHRHPHPTLSQSTTHRHSHCHCAEALI